MPAVGGFLLGAFGYGGAVAGTMAAGYAAGATFAASALGSIAVRLVTTVAISALSSALSHRSQQGGGLTLTATMRGEQNPETIILGPTATGGQAVCPPYSHGASNRYLTQIIELCSAPGATLDRLILGDTYVELGEEPHPDYGLPILGDLDGLAWVKYYDGTQTSADPMLIDKYGDHPDRPWTAAMIGTGICYAIVTLAFDQERQSQAPNLRFQMGGIPLYDIRKDTTAGGDGPQRWADPSTWEPSANPVVQLWNIWRGIALPGGEVWGGGFDAEAVPPANWIAQMNKADAEIELSAGGTEPAYRAGIEAPLTTEPAAIAEELLKAASAQVADMGGAWRILAGAPELPVYSFTDGDIIVTREQEYQPFPGLSETYNAVTAEYPDPESLWETKDAPPRTNAEWEAADTFGRRTANLQLPAVPWADQVQRLMRAYIEDERRMRRHIFTLPPDAGALELLDTLDYSSARNGYDGKDFTLYEISEDLLTGLRKVSLRERDPADYDWESSFELPSAPPVTSTAPAAVGVPGFNATGLSIRDGDDTARRPGIHLVWQADLLADGLRWEVRLTAAPDDVLRGTTLDLEPGSIVLTAGLLPGGVYQARARLLASYPTVWTPWVTVTVPDVRLTAADIDPTIIGNITAAQQTADAAAARAEEVLDNAAEWTQDMRDDLDLANEEADALRSDLVTTLGPLPWAAPADQLIAALQTGMASRIEDIARLDRDLDLRAAREVDADEALAEIESGLIRGLLDMASVRADMAGAGITVDEATGRVTIEAVQRLDGALGQISAELDAARAAISLRVTYSDVAFAIAEAQLDPADMPILTDLTARVSTAAANIDALAGAITLKADTVTVTGLNTRLTTVETDIDSLEAAIELRVTQTEFDALSSEVSDVQLTMAAFDGAAFGIALSDIRTLGEDIRDQDVVTIAQLLDAYRTRVEARADLAYLREDFRALVDEDRESITSLTTRLGAAFADAVSLIENETTARASETAALAEDITTMQGELDDAAAGLTEVNLIEADSASAAARALHQLQLEAARTREDVDGQALAIEDLDTSVEEIDGALEVAARDRRQLSAGVALTEDAAALADIRAMVLDHTARALWRHGIADARSDLYARVREGEEAAAGSLEELTVALADARALITEERRARATEAEATIQTLDALSALIDDAAVLISNEAVARASADVALGQEIDTLATATGNNAAAISAETTARTDALSALGQQVSDLTAASWLNAAAIQIERTARTDALAAQAERLELLETFADETGASVEEHATAIATFDGRAEATYALRLGAGGAAAGLEIVAADNPLEGPTESLRLFGSNIRLDGNVTVDGSFLTHTALIETAWISRAMIGEAQVDTLKIGAYGVTIDFFASRNEAVGSTGYDNASDPWSTYMTITLDLEHQAQGVVVDADLIITGVASFMADYPAYAYGSWSFRIIRQDTGGIIYSAGGTQPQGQVYIRGYLDDVPAGLTTFALQYRLFGPLGIQNARMAAIARYR